MSAMQILQALGGSQFQSQTSARAFSYPANGLAFCLARARHGIDRVLIMPAGAAFTMTFFRGDTKTIVADVSQDQLRATFALYTGV